MAADTAVVLEELVLGKPADNTEAAGMLFRLSGRVHQVVTGVFLLRTDDGRSARAVESTGVRFRTLSRPLIDWYVSTGEPLDKAGAYGIQGRGVLLTAGVEGSWTNVVGLPLERLPGLFSQIGFDLLDT
jgi:septum formation protein